MPCYGSGQENAHWQNNGVTMYKLLRRILFILPAEHAHTITLRLLRCCYRPWWVRRRQARMPKLACHVFGLHFPNPVGLAAGFDKNGDYIDALFGLGFGFIEVGCVTPRAQEGNLPPRLFRLPDNQALVNRMGFNNKGVDYLVQRLRMRKVAGIVGVNIGKNKNTPLESAVDDYVYCYERVYPYADFVSINISSPNTPGLRELALKTNLQEILAVLQLKQQKLNLRYRRQVPILLKLTVDFSQDQLGDILQLALQYGVAGIVMSNTTVDLSLLSSSPQELHGGLSGAPIRPTVTRTIEALSQQLNGLLPIVGVGGVMTADDALKHWRAGASLIEVYTGLVYSGPSLVKSIIQKISKEKESYNDLFT